MFRRPLLLTLSLLLMLCGGVVFAQGGSIGEIKGVVKDGRGNPVLNVVVRVVVSPTVRSSDRLARTDGNGRYLLDDLDAGSYGLVLQKPGWQTQQKTNVQVAGAQTLTLNWTLLWANSTVGAAEIYVRDNRGNPLPDATVDLLRDGTLQSRTPTDGAGGAIFPGLEPAAYSAVVRRPGFFDLIVPPFVVRNGGPTVRGVVLRRDGNQSGILRGTVRSQTGDFVPNALVKIIGGITGGQVRTNGAGEYLFQGLVPSPSYAIQVSASGFAAQAVGNLFVQALQTTVRDVTLVPNSATKGSLTGTVRDAGGVAVPFAEVTISLGPAQGQQAVTGPDGRYLFTGLNPAEFYAIVVEAAGFAPEGRSGINVQAGKTAVADVTLRFENTPPGSLQGTVREVGSGTALSGVSVEIIQGPSAGLATLTDGAGGYTFPSVIPGEGYTVRFSKDGYLPSSAFLVSITSGQSTTVNADLSVRLVQSGTISGTVKRITGEPVANAKVNLFAGPSAPLKTTTDKQGRYSFQNIRSGTGYGVRAAKKGFVTVEKRQIQVANGQTVVVDFQLSRGSTSGGIRGRVVDLIQFGIAGATVRVLTGPTIPEPVQTNAAGDFVLEDLPPGNYTLQASANGFRTGTQPNVFVTPDRVTDVRIQLLR
jgi:hypothetical protein